MTTNYKPLIQSQDKILNLIGFLIATFFIIWHTFDTSFCWFHDSTIAVQATIAKNWFLTGERIFLNGEEWITHPPLPVILAMPGEILNIPMLHRLIPLGLSIATLIFWYKFINLHYNDKKLAFIAVWFAAISPIFIYFAPVLNYEQPLFFFLLFGLYCYENFINYKKYQWLIGLAIAFLGAGFTEWQGSIIALGFIVDWKRGKWISLFPILFTGIAFICSASMINNFPIFIETVTSRSSVTFLSLNFWIIQFGRAFALFTPISFIISIYYWWNKPELKKNRIIFIQLISGIFLLLILSQWFSIHNFALYYFWLPISFGTAYLLNRFSNRARWIIQSITILFTCINLYFLSTYRETFIEPLVTFFQKENIFFENELVLSLGSRQYVTAYRLGQKYREYDAGNDGLNNNEILITAPLLMSPVQWGDANNIQNDKKELHIDFVTIFIDSSFFLPKPIRKIKINNKNIGFVKDPVDGSWVIFEGNWNRFQLIVLESIEDNKEIYHRFMPGNRTAFDPRQDDSIYYHWIPNEINKITSVKAIHYEPRISFVHEFIQRKSQMLQISHFALIERIETEFGIPFLAIFYNRSVDLQLDHPNI